MFEFLIGSDKTKRDNFDKISALDIARTLQFLGCRPTRADVELIIWVSFTFVPSNSNAFAYRKSMTT